MIKNDRQFKITKNQLKKFEETLEILKNTDTSEIHPLFAKAQLDSIESQIESLKREIKEYEAIKNGDIINFTSDFFELSSCIIKARIAKGLNHEEFGKLLDVTAQQIQKYESEDYSGTSLRRLQEIVKVLGLKSRVYFELKEIKTVGFLIPDGYNLEGMKDAFSERKMPLKMCVN